MKEMQWIRNEEQRVGEAEGDEGDGGIVVSVVALAIQIHEYGGGGVAIEVALKGDVCLYLFDCWVQMSCSRIDESCFNRTLEGKVMFSCIVLRGKLAVCRRGSIALCAESLLSPHMEDVWMMTNAAIDVKFKAVNHYIVENLMHSQK